MNILGIAVNKNYPNPLFWEIAAKTGNSVVIGMDAHTPEQLVNPKALAQAKILCLGMDRKWRWQ